MIDRNAEILRNKVEVLERRKAELLREIADKQARMTNLSAAFDEAVRAGRMEAVLVSVTGGGGVGVRRRQAERRGAVGPLKTGFKWGVIVSLFIGLVLVIFAK